MNTFTYEYSAKKNEELSSIRERYLPREETKLDRVRALDKRVRLAGVIESLSLGILGSLVFGIGMCFGLDVFGGADWLTILFGGIGTLMMLPCYLIYKRAQRGAKEKYGKEILALTEEIFAEDTADKK